MTEWGVVLVIIGLVGLIATVAAPIVKLNNNVTRMNTILERLDRSYDEDMHENTGSHRRLWEHNGKQDEKLSEHERRIFSLEDKEGK